MVIRDTAPSRVLIVDDELQIRELLRELLTSEGYAVATVPSGYEALDVVPTFQPDVILLDMLMPGLSGRDTLHALRLAGVTVPVILISGSTLPSVEGGAFFRVLRKTVDVRAIVDAVAAAVTHRRGAE